MRGYEIEGGSGACELCRRPAERLTRHHLLPRTRHRNKRNKKTSDRREIHRTVDLCGPCRLCTKSRGRILDMVVRF